MKHEQKVESAVKIPIAIDPLFWLDFRSPNSLGQGKSGLQRVFQRGRWNPLAYVSLRQPICMQEDTKRQVTFISSLSFSLSQRRFRAGGWSDTTWTTWDAQQAPVPGGHSRANPSHATVLHHRISRDTTPSVLLIRSPMVGRRSTYERTSSVIKAVIKQKANLPRDASNLETRIVCAVTFDRHL